MFDKLKKLFVIDDGSSKPDTDTAESTIAPASTTTSSSSSPAGIDLSNVTDEDYDTPQGKADPKFIDVLLKAIEKNNLEGFDYLEYKSSLQGLDDMAMDEGTRYKSAYVMAKTMGVTPEKLLESAKHYVGVLNIEEKKFNDALQNQRQRQIVGKEEELVRLQQDVEAKKAQIKQLEAEIQKTEAAYSTIKDNINENAAKVARTHSAFVHAYKVVLGQIMTDVDNMKKYLS